VQATDAPAASARPARTDPALKPVMAETSARPAASPSYLCGEQHVDPHVYARGGGLDDLTAERRRAVETAITADGTGASPDADAAWIVVEQSDSVVALLRPLGGLIHDGGGLLDHELSVARRVPADGLWVAERSTCGLRRDADPLAHADVRVSPDALTPAARAASELELLVTERSCNSGEDAEGRVEVVTLEERADEIVVWIAVRPRDGVLLCPGNPLTRFVVALDAPVGDRDIVDGSMVLRHEVAAYAE